MAGCRCVPSPTPTATTSSWRRPGTHRRRRSRCSLPQPLPRPGRVPAPLHRRGRRCSNRSPAMGGAVGYLAGTHRRLSVPKMDRGPIPDTRRPDTDACVEGGRRQPSACRGRGRSCVGASNLLILGQGVLHGGLGGGSGGLFRVLHRRKIRHTIRTTRTWSSGAHRAGRSLRSSMDLRPGPPLRQERSGTGQSGHRAVTDSGKRAISLPRGGYRGCGMGSSQSDAIFRPPRISCSSSPSPASNSRMDIDLADHDQRSWSLGPSDLDDLLDQGVDLIDAGSLDLDDLNESGLSPPPCGGHGKNNPPMRGRKAESLTWTKESGAAPGGHRR